MLRRVLRDLWRVALKAGESNVLILLRNEASSAAAMLAHACIALLIPWANR